MGARATQTGDLTYMDMATGSLNPCRSSAPRTAWEHCAVTGRAALVAHFSSASSPGRSERARAAL